MKITQVERQKKNSKRFNIYLDGKFSFGADEDSVVDHRLIVGKELSDEDLERILFATEVGKLMDRMYGLFSVRMRSEKEVRDYLRQLNFKRKLKDIEELPEIVVEALIQRLKDKDLLNDERFANEWIHARRVSKQKGMQAIMAELYQKGIARDIIVKAFEDADDGNEGSEESLAMKALEKKVKTPSVLEDVKEKQRIVGFLMRKGFSYDVARSVIEKYLKKE